MRDRLKLPRAFIALILAGSAEDCLEKLLVPRRLGELNGAATSQAEVSAHRY